MIATTATMADLYFPRAMTMTSILSTTLTIATPSWSVIVCVTLSPRKVDNDEQEQRSDN